jgi:hypothetical protein
MFIKNINCFNILHSMTVEACGPYCLKCVLIHKCNASLLLAEFVEVLKKLCVTRALTYLSEYRGRLNSG